MSKVNKIYEHTKTDRKNIERKITVCGEKIEKAKEDLRAAKLALVKAKESLDSSEKELKDENEKLAKNKEWRKKVQKRALILAKHAMKEDNSDLG